MEMPHVWKVCVCVYIHFFPSLSLSLSHTHTHTHTHTQRKPVESQETNKSSFNRPLLKQKLCCGASLVAQWLRICLPMQGTRVQALVWEDPTCRGETKPVRHNYGSPHA